MKKLSKLTRTLFLVYLLFAFRSAFGETCTGIAPPAKYTPTTVGLDFVNCSSVCGAYTPAPGAWNWVTSPAILPSTGWQNKWGAIPTVYGYPNIINSDDYSAPVNQEFVYDGTAGPNSFVGLTTFIGGDSHTDIWLLTNQRVVHVAGGEQTKCRNGSDGLNEPFIIVANGEIRVGWLMGTPSASPVVYSLISQAYPLQPLEVPISFNLTSNGPGVKWWNKLFFKLSSTFVDSGLRVRGKRKTYAFAADITSPPTSPVMITNKMGKRVVLALVDVGDAFATPVRVNTNSGIKAIRSYP